MASHGDTLTVAATHIPFNSILGPHARALRSVLAVRISLIRSRQKGHGTCHALPSANLLGVTPRSPIRSACKWTLAGNYARRLRCASGRPARVFLASAGSGGADPSQQKG